MFMQTLWYLQAYLSDLSSQPNSDSFKLCKRVTNKCQAIVFSDGSFTEEPDQETAAAISLGIPTHRVRENVIPAVVGIGALLAGIAQPLLTRQAGQIAIAQGRRNRALSVSGPSSQALARRNTTTGASRLSNQQQRQVGNGEDAVSVATSATTAATLVSETITTTVTSQATTIPSPSPPRPSTPVQTSTSQPNLTIPKRDSRQSLRDFPFTAFAASPSLEDLHRGKAFSVSRLVRSAQDKLSRTKLNRRSGSSSSGVFDSALATMGRSSVPTTEAVPLSPTVPAYSSEDNITHRGHRRRHHHHHPVSSSAATSVYSGSDSDSESAHSRSGTSLGSGSDDDDFSALSHVPLEHRRLLLKSNYFHSEMQFLLALVDISTRLVIVPKPARQSTLIAELTLLNHNLPAEICIPLWCPATTERPYHHRVVRISPQDAVVLNSAERVSLEENEVENGGWRRDVTEEIVNS